MVCKISQPKKGPCENGPWLRKNFATPKHPLWKLPPAAKWFCSLLSPSAKIFVTAKHPFGTRVPFRRSPPSFRSCEMVAKPSLGTWVPFCNSVPSFRSCEMGCEKVPKMPPFGKSIPPAKLLPCCENEKRPLASFLNVINSLFSILTGHLNFKKVPRGAKTEHPPVCLLRLSKPRVPLTIFSTQPWLELEDLSPRPYRLAWESQETHLFKAPYPSLRGPESSHLRLRTHLSVLCPGVITREGHLPWPVQALLEAKNQVPVPQRRKLRSLSQLI